MKQLLVLLAVIFSMNVHAQSRIKVDSSGNFYQLKAEVVYDSSSANTGKTYTDSKGIKYPVYMSRTGKYYILRTSKNTGNQYKQYLKIDEGQ